MKGKFQLGHKILQDVQSGEIKKKLCLKIEEEEFDYQIMAMDEVVTDVLVW